MHIAVLLKTKGLSCASHTRFWRGSVAWLLASWEVYPLLLLASFLRLYQLSWTEFDADQAMLASLPRMALAHGLIPGTGAFASIGLANPPGYVYLFLPLAAITASPLVDALFTALLNVLAVLLTYLFVRRYYGRLAGACAALLFAVAYQPVLYSRFLWQPNLLPFFTLLFIIALFRGVVEHRPGWFAAALPLWSFLLQLHLLTLYLAVPLLLALALAPHTVRWRDVFLGVALSCLLFLTYLLWEVGVHFADLAILLDTWRQPAHLDGQALRFYLDLVGTPPAQLAGPHSLLALSAPLLRWERWGLVALLVGGFVLALSGLTWGRVHLMDKAHVPCSGTPSQAPSGRLWAAWWVLAGSAQRAGLLILLAWQIAPVLLMTRHAVDLQFHYLLFLLPGPFIFIGLLCEQLALLLARLLPRQPLRLAVPALTVLLVVVQIFGTGAWVLDSTTGRDPHGVRYNTLQDLQAALSEADLQARVRHIRHVYIDADTYTYDAWTYLAAQMQTPHTLFSGSHCLLLPSSAQGPALLLLGPADTLDQALLTHIAPAVQIGQPPRLGGAPFHLYLVQPLAADRGVVAFAHTLSAARGQLAGFTWSDPGQGSMHMLTVLWTSLRAWAAADGTGYTYHFVARAQEGASSAVACSFSALAPGERLLTPFALSAGFSSQLTALTISGSSSIHYPDEQRYGPFQLLSVRQQISTPQAFRSTTGGESIVVSG
ncbi:MAG TPA: glycosyltransferase family 39 protein [Ktedonobacteraceae bacterium]|jgi:hypothetical protein